MKICQRTIGTQSEIDDLARKDKDQPVEKDVRDNEPDAASKKQALAAAKTIVTAGDEANRHPSEIMPALWALTVYKGVRGFSFVPYDVDSFKIYLHGSKKEVEPTDGEYDVDEIKNKDADDNEPIDKSNKNREEKNKTNIIKEEVELAGHTTDWSEMTQKEKNAFKHSYSRHQLELDLPNFKESNASHYQELFNRKVTEIRNTGRHDFFISKELLNGALEVVHRTEPVIDGKKYFYYETINEHFISAGEMSK